MRNLLLEKSQERFYAPSNAFRPFKVAFSPDSRTLAIGGSAGGVKLLDATSGRLLRTLDWQYPWPDRMAFSPDGRQLALANGGDSNDHLAVWDLASGRLLHSFAGYSGWGVYGMAFSPDGQMLAVVKGSGALRVWNLTSEKCLSAEFVGQESFVEPVVFVGDSDTVAECRR